MIIELAQQRSRLLRRLPKQTPRNDKVGCLCEQSGAISQIAMILGEKTHFANFSLSKVNNHHFEL